MEWSSDLVKRLTDEEQSLSHSLATLNPSDSAPSVKVHAERKLLALTPKAIDTLDEGMSCGLLKDRVVAAKEVLDRSPATRQQSIFSSEQTIPIEALTTILQGMANMFKGAQVQFANDAVAAAPSASKEQTSEAADQSYRTLGRSDAVPARRLAVRSDDPVYVDGVSAEEVLPSPSTKAARRSKQHKAKHQPGGLR